MTESAKDLESLKQMAEACERIRQSMAGAIVGQDAVVEQLLIAIFARGHCILEGVPGLAKTLMVSVLANALGLDFNRIQFTPDLMPSDITGTEILHEDKVRGERLFRFMPGPVFSNLLLADEINRTPPKTQAALLEAMQERQVSVGGTRHALPDPFFVLATQNPIEQEGTYPLPEAQQDRFMFKVFVRYPSFEEEYRIAEFTTGPERSDVQPVLESETMLEHQRLVRRLPAPPDVIRYALRLVRASRPAEDDAPPAVQTTLAWGAGPRAVQNLLLAGKSRAAIHGRPCVTTDDIRAVAHPVLRHRLLVNFAAEAEGLTADTIIDRLLLHLDTHEDEAVAIAPSAEQAFAGEARGV